MGWVGKGGGGAENDRNGHTCDNKEVVDDDSGFRGAFDT